MFTVINIPAFGCGSAQNAHTYDILAIRTGGRSESICGRGGQLDYAPLMQDIARAAAGIASAYRLDGSPIASTFKAGIQQIQQTTRWWSLIAPGPSGSTMTTRRTRSCCKATWGYRTMTDSG